MRCVSVRQRSTAYNRRKFHDPMNFYYLYDGNAN